MLQRHKESIMHKKAQQLEAARLVSERNGGIRQVFSSRVVVQRQGALRLLYWLAKDVAQTYD